MQWHKPVVCQLKHYTQSIVSSGSYPQITVLLHTFLSTVQIQFHWVTLFFCRLLPSSGFYRYKGFLGLGKYTKRNCVCPPRCSVVGGSQVRFWKHSVFCRLNSSSKLYFGSELCTILLVKLIYYNGIPALQKYDARKQSARESWRANSGKLQLC